MQEKKEKEKEKRWTNVTGIFSTWKEALSRDEMGWKNKKKDEKYTAKRHPMTERKELKGKKKKKKRRKNKKE